MIDAPASVPGRLATAGALAIVAFHAIVALAAARRLGVTTDEPVGIAGGLALLTRGEMRINVEHPPLVKALAALPLLGWHPGIDAADPDYAAGREWAYARRFMFDSGRDVDAILARSRSATMTLGVILALAVWRVATRIHGAAGGLLALAFHALDPAFLGHGPIVQFDVGLSLFVFLGAFSWLRALRGDSLAWYGAAGACLGLGLGTKFSALYLPALWLLLAFLERRTAAAAAAALLLCYAVILAPDLARGFLWQVEHARRGHMSYFWGSLRPRGSPAYFPVAFLLKTPLETLGGLLLLAVMAWKLPLPRDARLSLAAGAAFIVLLVPATINIGHRYMLPALPFLSVALGALATRAAWRGTGIALAALLTLRMLVVFPDYVGFTNGLAGRHPERYLADSNLDWGQDLPRLRAWLAARGNPEVSLAYAGTDSPEHRGIRSRPAPCSREPGLHAASINCVVGISPPRNPGCFTWLAREPVLARIGTSLLLYEVRPDAP
jgi:hypothetical protein